MENSNIFIDADNAEEEIAMQTYKV